MLGTFALSAGYYDAYYGRAQRVRTKIADDFRTAFAECDLIVTPTSPTVAFKLGERTDNPLAMYLSDYCTVPMSLAGIPAISIPAGLSKPDGGGPATCRSACRSRDRRSAIGMLDAAHALERAIEFDASAPTAVARASAGDYEPVIGLEIHVQLSTNTKMFCGCALSFGDPPNMRTCPVCLGHPGTLPTMNEEAVHYGLMIGVALECEIPARSIFHRKNYFYPDLPKGYQISQYDEPLAVEGHLGDVRIHRAHLEEDAAKLTHVGESGRIHGAGASLVDFNRGGTPLVEIVTEPDLRSPAQARDWAQLLRTTIRQLGVSDVNMEEGSLRVDGNISLRPAGSEELGVKTELKNMNSFRFLERGIEAELERQRDLIECGGGGRPGDAPLRSRDGSLTPLRSKEYAHDYRYFPEPDLVPVAPTEEMLGGARVAARAAGGAARALPNRGRPLRGGGDDPRVPGGARRVLRASGGRGRRHAGQGDRQLGHRRAGRDPSPGGRGGRSAGVEGDPRRRRRPGRDGRGQDDLPRGRQAGAGEARGRDGGDPAQIVEREGLAQISDTSELEGIVDRAIEAEPEAAEQVRQGNERAIGRIVGAVMKETKGRADGGAVTKLIRSVCNKLLQAPRRRGILGSWPGTS